MTKAELKEAFDNGDYDSIEEYINYLINHLRRCGIKIIKGEYL